MADLTSFDMASIGGIASNFAMSFMNVFWIVLAIAVGGGVIVGIALIISNVKKYDITTRIYSKRYGGWKTWTEPSAYTKHKDTGEVYGFQIKGVKKIQNPPPLSCLYPDAKGKNVLHAIQVTFDEYVWFNPAFDDIDELLRNIEDKK